MSKPPWTCVAESASFDVPLAGLQLGSRDLLPERCSSHLETHPTPQFVRSRWFDLNGLWAFAYDDEDRGLDEGWQHKAEVFDRQIVVPYPPESRASGIGDTGFHPVVWYRRAFEEVRDCQSERLLLHFGAVDYLAHVWVDGTLVATHEGGQTPFAADVTAACGDRRLHSVVVRAEDRPHHLGQPRGKQDWLEHPHGIWYHRTTGIWQPVWLEPAPPQRLERLRWETDPVHARVRLTVGLNVDPPAGSSLGVALHHRGAIVAAATSAVGGVETEIEIKLSPTTSDRRLEELLWSPESPVLLDATVTLCRGDERLDTVASYVGLRTVGVANGRFTVNEAPVYLRMVLHQGYRPDTHLASTPDGFRREVELIRELGFNGVRIHQKVEDPRFLYWCDRLGLLVWGEMANAVTFSAAAAARLAREWSEVVQRDAGHPSIVAWVPMNESWGAPDVAVDSAQRSFVQALYFLTKTIDRTRPVIANDGWEYVIGDLVTVHDYEQDPQTIQARYGTPAALARTLRGSVAGDRRIVLEDIPAGGAVMLTEFGGISLRPAAGKLWFAYGIAESHDEFRERLERLFAGVHACSPLAGFCYTQFTDTLQETNGLLTADGVPKLDPAVIREIVLGAASPAA